MQTIREWMNLVENTIADDLYHGTSIVNAAAIVSQKTLVGDASHGDRDGVSFTRLERLGWDFASIAEDRELDLVRNHPVIAGHPSGRGALLVFDGAAIRAALGKRLTPYVWSPQDGVDDEEEERFHGSHIKVENFLTAIIGAPSDFAWWAQAIPHLDSFQPAFAKTVAAIPSNPLFRWGS